MEDHSIIQFDNGIRLVHKKVNNTKIVHCGIMLDIGSRDESENLQGVTHFWEHMAFKGTRKRNSFQIINSLESVGGELNAFTTKEKICFHASVLSEYFEKAIDLLSDIVFFSTFPEKDIDKERKIILDEMLMYEDLPEESIQDDFDMTIFSGQSIGRNILGNQKSLKRLRQNHFINFIKRNMNSRKIVISVVGNLDLEYCIKISGKYIRNLPVYSGTQKRIKPVVSRSKSVKIKKNNLRAYCAIGFPAYSVKNKKRLKLFMLSNILGGPSMNSRLNMELRERRGLVYSIDVSYMPYTDTGVIGIYFGAENGGLDKSIELVKKELKRLREFRLGKIQINQAKDQLVGQLAMAEENNASLMIMMGRSLLDLNRIDLLENIIKEIRSVTSDNLMEIANEIFIDNKMCQVIYAP